MNGIDISRNWTEDSNHENGNYMNTCSVCDNDFIGHKRRRVCKLCASPSPSPVSQPNGYEVAEIAVLGEHFKIEEQYWNGSSWWPTKHLINAVVKDGTKVRTIAIFKHGFPSSRQPEVDALTDGVKEWKSMAFDFQKKYDEVNLENTKLRGKITEFDAKLINSEYNKMELERENAALKKRVEELEKDL